MKQPWKYEVILPNGESLSPKRIFAALDEAQKWGRLNYKDNKAAFKVKAVRSVPISDL